MINNSPKQVVIVSKKQSAKILRRIMTDHSSCYFLSDDYACFMDLKNHFGNTIEIVNLSGIFDKIFQRIKEDLLESLSELNRRYNSYAWWGGQVASKSLTTTPLCLNITYFFCARELLLKGGADMVFIVESPALAKCLTEFSMRQGFSCIDHHSKFSEWCSGLKHCLYYVLQIGIFSLKVMRNHRTISKNLKASMDKKTLAKKRVIIRSWVTNNIFDRSEKFRDRNFGHLPEWLDSKDYEVWILPIFFNLFDSMEQVCGCIRDSNQKFLMPEHYLRFSDYVSSIYNGYKVLSTRITRIQLKGEDISLFVSETLKRRGLDVDLCMLNLSGLMLKRLKRSGFDVDAFYYAFECNAPENQFILSCRKHYPEASVRGFQHTGFFANQLAYHLAPGEQEHHPLPDKIICSSASYRDLNKKAGIPPEILENGPNLRFQPVSSYIGRKHGVLESDNYEKALLLPLSYSYDLTLELLEKIRDALDGVEGYKVYLRAHPLQKQRVLKTLVQKANVGTYAFAIEGSTHEWLSKAHAVISTGATITVLEAVSFGTPVIRVIPDNTFHLDVFSDSSTFGYPLDPVNSPLEIRQQLQMISEKQKSGKAVFGQIAEGVSKAYFPKVDEDQLKVFL